MEWWIFFLFFFYKCVGVSFFSMYFANRPNQNSFRCLRWHMFEFNFPFKNRLFSIDFATKCFRFHLKFMPNVSYSFVGTLPFLVGTLNEIFDFHTCFSEPDFDFCQKHNIPNLFDSMYKWRHLVLLFSAKIIIELSKSIQLNTNGKVELNCKPIF